MARAVHRVLLRLLLAASLPAMAAEPPADLTGVLQRIAAQSPAIRAAQASQRAASAQEREARAGLVRQGRWECAQHALQRSAPDPADCRAAQRGAVSLLAQSVRYGVEAQLPIDLSGQILASVQAARANARRAMWSAQDQHLQRMLDGAALYRSSLQAVSGQRDALQAQQRALASNLAGPTVMVEQVPNVKHAALPSRSGRASTVLPWLPLRIGEWWQAMGIHYRNNLPDIAPLTAEGVEFVGSERLEAELKLILPDWVAHDCLRELPIADSMGIIQTDLLMRNPDHREIFAVGDCAAVTMPKIGGIGHQEAEIVGRQVALDMNRIDPEEANQPLQPVTFCIGDMGARARPYTCVPTPRLAARTTC